MVVAVVLAVVLALALFVFLIALLRWLITGQKPRFTMHTNAYQQWKNTTSRRHRTPNRTEDVIEAEVREVPRDSNRLP
jgi:C4-dicarboxylate-specific signal transduction histidine kinase